MTDFDSSMPYTWLVNRLCEIDKFDSILVIHEEILKLYSFFFEQLNADSISFEIYSSLVDLLGGFEYEHECKYYE